MFLEIELSNFLVWKSDVNSDIGKKVRATLLKSLLGEELDPKKHLQDA